MASLDVRQVLLAPVVSEKSYNQIDENRYTFVFTQIPKATATSRRPMAVRSDCTAQGTDLTCLARAHTALRMPSRL